MLNRRGFIAAIFAAPLAAAGIFAGSHSPPGKNSLVEYWCRCKEEGKVYFCRTIIDCETRKVVRDERWPGEKPPWVCVGSFVDQHALRGTLLA